MASTAGTYFFDTGVEAWMLRASVAAVVLVIAILLAGCAGGTDDVAPESDGPPTTDGTADPPGAAAATPSPTPAGPVYELPLVGATVASSHNETLRSAGSYTAETNVTIAQGSSGESVSVQATAAVDAERGTMLVNGTTGGIAHQVTYVAPDGTAYQRVATGTGEVQYQQLEDAPEVTTYFQLPVESLVEEANFTYAGRDRVAGTPVAVYEVTELDALVAPAQVSTVESEGLQAFEVRLAISDDGLIRQFDYRVEVELEASSRTVATSITFHDVGTTTVEPPDWLDEAR